MFDFMIVQEASVKWGISTRRIQILCSTGRIPGAAKRAGSWFIPSDVEKPIDARAGRKAPRKDNKDDMA